MNNTLKNNYNFDMVCTYYKIKDYEYSELLYKIQYLQLFFLEDYKDSDINYITYLLFNNFINNKKIKELLKSTSLKDDLLTAFRMFFAYPTLYMFHKLLSDLYYEKVVDNDNYEKLINFAKTNY